MNVILERLIKNRKKVIVSIYLFIIFMSCFLFPIIPTNFDVYLSFPLHLNIMIVAVRLQMICICMEIGKVLRFMYPNKIIDIFLKSIGLNCIGFTIRLVMEWGESTLVQELTFLNIFMHLFIIPAVILLAYVNSRKEYE